MFENVDPLSFSAVCRGERVNRGKKQFVNKVRMTLKEVIVPIGCR